MKAIITTAILASTAFTASAQTRTATGQGSDISGNAAYEERIMALEARMTMVEQDINDILPQLPPESSIIATTYTGPVTGWTDCANLDGRTLIGGGTYNDPVLGEISYSLGDTGGAVAVQLSVDEMPSHSHKQPGRRLMLDRAGEAVFIDPRYTGITDHAPPTAATGGNEPHENRMPYQVVRFLCKQ